ncbi:MAG: hypothetical protein ABW034_00785 [Steroidobacteraceae bacterium]
MTIDPLGAKYLGFDLTTPWLVSVEHIRGTGSLNSNQAVANKDGTYTYIVAAQDPGVRNWVDTQGLHQGQIWLRWQVLPQGTKSADNAVRAVKVVKLSELDSALPAGTQRLGAAQRQQLLQERVLAYAHRFGDASFEPQKVAAEEP